MLAATQTHCSPPSVSLIEATLAFGPNIIFEKINLTLQPGKWLALLGPSGVGKSSLLRFIAQLASKDERITGTASASNGLPLSEQIAYMAQTDLLLPWLTVLDNAMLGMKLRGANKTTKKTGILDAKQLLTKVGLAHALHLYPQQLSGGMRQRVALVRTLLENKPIVLMDEPFSALDAISRYKLQALAAELLPHKTVFFITHDPLEALRLADEIYLLQGQPAHLKFVTSINLPRPRELIDPGMATLQQLLFDELQTSVEA